MLASKENYLSRIRNEIAGHRLDTNYAVLEAAAGVGVTGLAIARSMLEGQSLVIVDSNLENLDLLSAQFASEPLNIKPTFIRGDIRDLSQIPEASFDLICSDTTVNMLGHEYYKGFREFYRVLRPGGTLFIREIAAPAIEIGFRTATAIFSRGCFVRTYASG